MSNQVFEDKRATQLLSRVGEDLSSLRHDVKTLLSHTTRHTLPEGARELAKSGREQLLVGREQAVRGARQLRHTAREHPAGISLGGVLLLGAVALGAYYLIRGSCCVEENELDYYDE